MVKTTTLILLAMILPATALEAAGKKKINKIVWLKAEINTELTEAQRTNSSSATSFEPVLRDVQYEYTKEILLSENAKARMPKDFTQFLEVEGAPEPVQRSLRQIRKEVVGTRQTRALDLKDYYACSYEATDLVCIRDAFELIQSDIETVLPKAFTRYLYTRKDLEEIQNFYFID